MVWPASNEVLCPLLDNFSPGEIVSGPVKVGEFAENEMRKDFTKSERVAIAAALEREMGNGQGQRTDLKEKEFTSAETEQPVFPETQVESQKKTRNIVAKKAGLGSGVTFQQAKTVVDHGVDELREAMDKNSDSVKSAAYFFRSGT